MRSKV